MTTHPAMAPHRGPAARPSHAAPHPARPGARDAAGPPPPSQDTLDGRFTHIARRRPKTVAVHEPGGELTFAKADLWASRLASMLMHGGVQLGDPVIVHCDDHRQSLMAQLAVLKAGGVCVPAAYGLGVRELRAIGTLSGASTVLCSLSTRKAWARRYTTLALDGPEAKRRITTHRLEPVLPLSHPAEAAYLLLSHEGLGAPTGHLVDHRAWRLAVDERVRTAGPAPHRVYVAGPPSSPATLSAMWWAFTSGASLRTMPRPGSPAGGDGTLCAAVCAPEEYATLLDALPLRPRLVQLVGGPVPAGLLTRHFAALPGTRLRADFAPTDGVLPWTSRELIPPGNAPHTLGTPVPQVRIRVVDGRGRVLASDLPGELCATGPALPFTVVHHPGHSAPAWEEATFLRSGVSARRLPDGSFELAAPAT